LSRTADDDISKHLDDLIERVWLRRKEAHEELRRRTSLSFDGRAEERIDFSRSNVARNMNNTRLRFVDAET
jgi:hypothetical protein